jgi:hypothetical protein
LSFLGDIGGSIFFSGSYLIYFYNLASLGLTSAAAFSFLDLLSATASSFFLGDSAYLCLGVVGYCLFAAGDYGAFFSGSGLLFGSLISSFFVDFFSSTFG